MKLSPFTALIVLGTVSKFGNALFALALPILFLTEAKSPALAVMALSIQAVPYLISPVLGEVIDRYDSRQVYFVAQLILGVCILLIPFVLESPAAIFALLMFSGVGGVLAGLLNYYKLIPSLVPEEQLESAIGTYMSVTDTAKLAGPVAGGVLIAVLGPSLAVTFNALTFFLSAVGILFILKPSPPVQRLHRPWLPSLHEGFRFFMRSRDLKFLAGTMAVSNLGTGILDSVFITALTDLHGAPVTLTGLALTAGGVAAILGSKLTYRILPGATLGRRILVWQGVMLAAALLFVLPSAWLLTLGFCLGLFSTSASNVITIAYRRKTIPEHLQGRVNANVRMFITGALPVAGLLFGFVAHQSGVMTSLYLVPLFSLLSLVIWAIYALGPASRPSIGRTESDGAV